MRKPRKVEIRMTVLLDEDGWASEYHMEKGSAEIVSDVYNYVCELVRGSSAYEAGLIFNLNETARK